MGEGKVQCSHHRGRAFFRLAELHRRRPERCEFHGRLDCLCTLKVCNEHPELTERAPQSRLRRHLLFHLANMHACLRGWLLSGRLESRMLLLKALEKLAPASGVAVHCRSDDLVCCTALSMPLGPLGVE